MTSKKVYKVFEFDSNIISKHPNDYESLVALQSYNASEYVGKKCKCKSAFSKEGVVCVQNSANKSKCIYRKIVSYSAHGLDKNHAMLSQRSMNQLDIKENDEIIIKRTCKFCFLWNHYDSTLRHPFRVAFVMGFISIILALLSIILAIL